MARSAEHVITTNQSPSSSRYPQFDRQSLIGRQLPVAVSYVDKFDNRKFSVALYKYVHDLGKLINDLNEHVCLMMTVKHSIHGGHVVQPEPFALKRPCAALYKEDDVWYRGEMLTYDDEADEIAVRFVDFGNTELIPSANVIPLPDKFLRLPAQSLRCRFINSSNNDSRYYCSSRYENGTGISANNHTTVTAESTNFASAVPRNQPKPYDLLYRQMVAHFILIDDEGIFVLEFVTLLRNIPRAPKNGTPPLTSMVTNTAMTSAAATAAVTNGHHRNVNGLINGLTVPKRKVDVTPLADNNENHVTASFNRQSMLVPPTTASPNNNVLHTSSNNTHSPSPVKNGVHNGGALFNTALLKPSTAACLPVYHCAKKHPSLATAAAAATSSPPINNKAYFGFNGKGCPKTRMKIPGLKSLRIPAWQGGYLDVCLCHLESTEKFYVHLLHHAEKVEQLKAKLTRYCADLCRQESLHRLKPEECELGLICAAYRLGSDTGKIAFYRCLVVERLVEEKDEDESHVVVNYVDYGFTEKISTRFLFVLHELYKKLPPYAVECSLKDVPSNKRTNSKFADNVRDYRTLCIRLENINPRGTGFDVTLFDDSCSNLSMHIIAKTVGPLKVRVASQI